MQAMLAARLIWTWERFTTLKTNVPKVRPRFAGTKNPQIATQWQRENSDKVFKSIMLIISLEEWEGCC